MSCIYENHLDGGLYTSDTELSWEQLYCEQCGDSDWPIGEANNRKEARELLEDSDYVPEYLKIFVNSNWEE